MSMFKARVPLYNETVGADTDGLVKFGQMAAGAAVLLGAIAAGNWAFNTAQSATGTEEQVNVPVIN